MPPKNVPAAPAPASQPVAKVSTSSQPATQPGAGPIKLKNV